MPRLRELAAPILTLDGAALATVDPASLIFRRVLVRGTWDYDHEVELRYRSFDGQPGIHLLTPLRIDGSDRAILVDRRDFFVRLGGPQGRTQFRQGATGEVEGLVYESIHQDGAPTSSGGDRLDAFSQVDVAAIGRRRRCRWCRSGSGGCRAATISPRRAPRVCPTCSNGTTSPAYMIQWCALRRHAADHLRHLREPDDVARTEAAQGWGRRWQARRCQRLIRPSSFVRALFYRPASAFCQA